MKKLPAVSEMEHITSREFGENMDAILERVAKEDVALIIDHAGRRALPRFSKSSWARSPMAAAARGAR